MIEADELTSLFSGEPQEAEEVETEDAEVEFELPPTEPPIEENKRWVIVVHFEKNYIHFKRECTELDLRNHIFNTIMNYGRGGIFTSPDNEFVNRSMITYVTYRENKP